MYQIEYSVSSIFECEYCMELIITGSIKLGEEKIGKWYHLDCFFIVNEKLEINQIDNDGLFSLRVDDLRHVRRRLLSGKRKIRNIDNDEDDVTLKMSKIDEDIEIQQNLIWTVKDKLRSTVITEKVNKLLVLNKQYNNYVDRSESIEAASDLIVFGCLENCLNCDGRIAFKKNKYTCSKCEKIINSPKRSDVKIPKNNSTFEIFESLEKLKQKRILSFIPEKSQSVEKAISSSKSFSQEHNEGETMKVVNQLEEAKGVVKALESQQNDTNSINETTHSAEDIEKSQALTSTSTSINIPAESVKNNENVQASSSISINDTEEFGKVVNTIKTSSSTSINYKAKSGKDDEIIIESTREQPTEPSSNTENQSELYLKSLSNNTRCFKCKSLKAANDRILKGELYLVKDNLKYHKNCV